MDILIATANPHKIEELQILFAEVLAETAPTLRFLSLVMAQERYHTPTIPDVEETGATFEENAYIKAQAYFSLWGIPVISDDSGLEVDVLGGRPGVYSARYGGESTSFAEKRKLIAQEVSPFPLPHTARFRCVMCYHDGLRTYFAEGSVEGEIVPERGAGGFGYDAQFQPLGTQYTFGEMPTHQKHHLSHRGHASRALAEQLRALWVETDTQE